MRTIAAAPVHGRLADARREIRVVDRATCRTCRATWQTIGEVVIRGDNVMDGYFREPDATAAVMTGPWFHTGDMAVWDEEGYIHIVDRKKDIIISGGENISSIEVEKPSPRTPPCWKPRWSARPIPLGRNPGGIYRFQDRVWNAARKT